MTRRCAPAAVPRKTIGDSIVFSFVVEKGDLGRREDVFARRRLQLLFEHC